jgi:EpsI family protein
VNKLRPYLPAILLLFGCALVLQTRSQVAIPLAAPLSTILSGVGGYTVKEQRVSDEERRVAGMSDYVARLYYRDSAVAFTTYVGYYDRQTQGKTIHSPRNCLPGAGWEILNGDRRPLQVGGARYVLNHYLLKKGGATAVVYYWYQGRGRIVANEYTVKWNLLRDAAVAGHTEEALVRIVVPVRANALDNTPASRNALAEANALGASIATRMITDVSRVLPKQG